MTTTAGHNSSSAAFPSLVDLNVGGVHYTTRLQTLTGDAGSLLAQLFSGELPDLLMQDSKGRYFIDRDGVLFRYILEYLRNKKLILPESFMEKERLRHEADYYKLPSLVKSINNAMTTNLKVQLSPLASPNDVKDISVCPPASPTSRYERIPGFITIAYRGTFAFGRDGLADVKFRKLTRVLICGKVSLCRFVFGETLNESRDPDRGTDDRYTSRFFLKHNFVEQAFDMLHDAGFRMVGTCGSGTNNSNESKPGMESEENKWNHYNEFIFYKC